MKRNEMLSRMSFLIDSMIYLKKDCHEMADAILQMQEELGMVPPANEGSIKIEEGKDGQLFIPIWRWEDEENS